MGNKIPMIFPAVLAGNKVRYLLRDDFTTALAAGAVNGTAAEPGPGGARTVVDAESKITIDYGSLIHFAAQATPVTAEEYLSYQAAPVTRSLGKVIYTNIRSTVVSTGEARFLVMLNTLPANFSTGIDFHINQYINNFWLYDRETLVNTEILSGVLASFYYDVWAVLRASGHFVFVRAKETGYPILRWVSPGKNTATLYPTFAGYDKGYYKKTLRVLDNLTYIPVPMASDTFDRAAIGSTDGAAHAEANGGGGLAWTDRVGTVGISGNAAIATAVDGGIAIATYTGSSPDGFFTIKPTKATTGAGRVLRYVDVDNYLFVYYDGTNVVFTKRVAGVETNLVTAASAAGNDQELAVQLNGTKASVFHKAALKGTEQTVPASTATMHGLYFKDTDSTLNNLVDWPSGAEGQHAALLRVAVNPGLTPVSASRIPDPPPTGCFSFAILGDTQTSAGSYPENMTAVGDWLRDMAAAMNIKCVLHVGDIVNVEASLTEWGVMSALYDKLDTINMPYIMGTGNHDIIAPALDDRVMTRFHTYFPPARFTGKSWGTGGLVGLKDAARSDNSYLLMTIDGVDYIFIALEWGPSNATVVWCDALLTTYAARKAIIVTHSYMKTNNLRVQNGDAVYDPHLDLADTHSGEELWTELIKIHDNVILVYSGHEPGVGRMTSDSDGGQAVAQVLFNTQSSDTTNSTYFRIITIDPTAKTIRSQTFSPNVANTVCDRTAANDFIYTWTI